MKSLRPLLYRIDTGSGTMDVGEGVIGYRERDNRGGLEIYA